MIKVAILALQGSFAEHKKMLDLINQNGDFQDEISHFEIRQKADAMREFDALILPGGESTTIGKLLKDLDIFDVLKDKIKNNLPTFGTCAGAILLAKNIVNDDRKHFGLLDVSIKRNAYGRQLGSFRTNNEFVGIGEVEMVFVRAPIITEIGNNVKILSKVDGNIVAAQSGNIIATSYHPELTNDTRVHKYFLSLTKGS